MEASLLAKPIDPKDQTFQVGCDQNLGSSDSVSNGQVYVRGSCHIHRFIVHVFDMVFDNLASHLLG